VEVALHSVQPAIPVVLVALERLENAVRPQPESFSDLGVSHGPAPGIQLRAQVVNAAQILLGKHPAQFHRWGLRHLLFYYSARR